MLTLINCNISPVVELAKNEKIEITTPIFTVVSDQMFKRYDIYFKFFPNHLFRDLLKRCEIYFHGVKKCWYTKNREFMYKFIELPFYLEECSLMNGKTGKKRAKIERYNCTAPDEYWAGLQGLQSRELKYDKVIKESNVIECPF